MRETFYFSKPTFEGAEKAGVLAEAEVHFPAESVFAGLKLTGIQVRKSKVEGRDGKYFITFPAKGVGTGEERRYFDFVRSVDPMSSTEGRKAVQRLRRLVAEQYDLWKEMEGGRSR